MYVVREGKKKKRKAAHRKRPAATSQLATLAGGFGSGRTLDESATDLGIEMPSYGLPALSFKLFRLGGPVSLARVDPFCARIPAIGELAVGGGSGTGYDVVLSKHDFYPLRLRLDFITYSMLHQSCCGVFVSSFVAVSGRKSFSTSLHARYTGRYPFPNSPPEFLDPVNVMELSLSLCLHALYPSPLYRQQLYRRVLRVRITEVEIPSVSQDASRRETLNPPFTPSCS